MPKITESQTGAAAATTANAAMGSLKLGIATYNGLQGGVMNAMFAPQGVNAAGAFAVGFFSGFLESTLTLNGVPCYIAAGIGGATEQVGNDFLAKGTKAFSWEGLGNAVVSGVISGVITKLLGNSCFLAGTPVLLGDGTLIPIESLQVGQRVTTDGGVSNSADGQTAAAAPNATAVDPATWRLVTIIAGDWEVQTLQSLDWITAYYVAPGQALPLTSVLDLAEMGAPDGLVGTVQSITDCPPIEGGMGRVVLTTVSHLNNFVFHLTLMNGEGDAETLGVTGWHRFYSETRGWIVASELVLGEQIRSAEGVVTVTDLAREPGMHRVYNITVEADHVYYVGDLTALTHNICNNERHPTLRLLQGWKDEIATIMKRLRLETDGRRAEIMWAHIRLLKKKIADLIESN